MSLLISKNIQELSDEELFECYISESNSAKNNNAFNRAMVYSTELQRRENAKTNRIMKRWTIAIGVMTAVMLLVTILNVKISCGG